MAVSGQAPHVVVLAFAQQGHINPLIQLSRKLVSYGCFVTFVVSENNVPSSSSHPNLHFQGVPDLLPPERSRGSDILDSIESMTNMEAGVRDLLHRLHRLQHHPVSFILSDVFILWSRSLASDFSIPCVAFFTSNANISGFCLTVSSLVSKGVLPLQRDDKGAIIASQPVHFHPGVPPLLPQDFPLCVTFDSSHFRYKFFMEMSENVRCAAAVTLNTFEELEEQALREIRKEKPCYALGPLLLLSGAPSQPDVKYWPEDSQCLQWLDTQKPDSVLYVSFGSVASLPAKHLRELASGIEASGQPFLWVIRSDSVEKSVDDALPDGFLSRTKDRGLIISWAPQILVLSHPSVGGFLTHGGWNSILENLATGGVPMICWPHIAEQRANRRLLVDVWKIGMEFRHEEDEMVEKEEVEKVVRRMMEEQEGKEMRTAVKKVRDAAKKAVEEDGSSIRNFKAFVESLGMTPK